MPCGHKISTDSTEYQLSIDFLQITGNVGDVMSIEKAQHRLVAGDSEDRDVLVSIAHQGAALDLE